LEARSGSLEWHSLAEGPQTSEKQAQFSFAAWQLLPRLATTRNILWRLEAQAPRPPANA